jgi:hypothetical protein
MHCLYLQEQEPNDVLNHAIEYLEEYQKVSPNWKSLAIPNALNQEKNYCI